MRDLDLQNFPASQINELVFGPVAEHGELWKFLLVLGVSRPASERASFFF